jgi:outer membrane protein assembly factor BamB
MGCLLFVIFSGWLGQESPPPASLTSPFVKAWTYLTTDTLRYKGAVTDGHHVYVPLASGELLALDGTTGERLWVAPYQGQLAVQLQVDDQAVYVATRSPIEAGEKSDNVLLALNKRTGELRWRKSFDEPTTALTRLDQANQSGADRLYIGTAAGSVIALDLSTRERAWLFRSRGAVRGHVRQHEGVVYVGSDDGHLYALDAATGAERWRLETRGPVRAPVEVSSNRIFVGSFDGWVYCLERQTGKRRWSMRTGAAIEAQPTLVAETLVVGSYDNFVYAVDPDSGALRWKVKLSGRIIADPITLGDSVLLSVLRDDRVVILRVGDGQETNSLELGQGFEIVAAPALAGEVLILTTDQGIIAARLISSASR